jgi:hypothetical protein
MDTASSIRPARSFVLSEVAVRPAKKDANGSSAGSVIWENKEQHGAAQTQRMELGCGR